MQSRLPNALPTDRLREYARACVRIDTRSLALFRILLGLLLAADSLLRARNLVVFYTDAGAVPADLAATWTGDYAFSIFYYVTDPTFVAILFVVQFLVGILLAAGYRTRTATVLAFLFAVSLDHRNPLVVSYADVIFRLLLFWGIFLPLGERWSVDAVHREASPRDSVVGLASVAILLQMVSMYLINGLHKTAYDSWISGEITPLVFGLEHLTFLLGDVIATAPTLLVIGGLVWFYMLLFAWLLLVLRGRARTLLVGLFVAGHLSFAVTVRIGAFPYATIAGVVLFLQASFWDDLVRVARRLGLDPDAVDRRAATLATAARRVPNPRIATGLQERYGRTVYDFALYAVVIAFGIVAVVAALQAGGIVPEDTSPDAEVRDALDAVGVEPPRWTIFVPPPEPETYYYVVSAETADGEVIDVFNDRPVSYERPHDQLQRQFDAYRERFYMTVLRSTSYERVRTEYGDYRCRSWADDGDADLKRFSMYRVVEEYDRETLHSPEDRDVRTERFYDHSCGDAEPGPVAPPESLG